MYFFVQDNNMASTVKVDLNLKDLKNRKFSDKLMSAIGNSFVTIIKKEILESINEFSSRKETLDALMLDDTDDWLPRAILEVFSISNAFTNFQRITNQIITPGKEKEFLETFMRNTEATVRLDNGGKNVYPQLNDVIQTTIEITPGAGPDASEIFKMLATIFYGGELKAPEQYIDKNPEGEDTYVVNATPGFRQQYIQEAADRLRDWMVERYKGQVVDNLKQELKDELKNMAEVK